MASQHVAPPALPPHWEPLLSSLCVEIKWKFETQRISGTEGQTLLFSSKSSSAAPRNGVTML